MAPSKLDWSLVGHLATLCKCGDPEELRHITRRMQIHAFLEQMPVGGWPLEAWYTAACYIVGGMFQGNAGDIRDKLLLFLSMEPPRAAALDNSLLR